MIGCIANGMISMGCCVNFSTVTRLFRLMATCSVLITFQAIAEDASSDVETLIKANKWKEATRAVFIEAREAYKHEPSISIGLAKAGFLEEALDTVAREHPNTWSWRLLSLVREVPSIPQAKKEDLIQKSLDAARNETGKAANYIKSGDLARLALFYSREGKESQAKSVFSEAVVAAEKGMAEEGSGGYRQITEAMARDHEAVKAWMLDPLRENVGRTGEPFNVAFACLDLASVTKRIGRTDQESEFVKRGIAAAKKIDKAPMRKSALDQLAVVAQEIGVADSGLEIPPDALAVREAAAGNAPKAYVIVSSLGQTLYVDHQMAAYEKVFNDAIKRDDLTTALYFAERPIKKISSAESGVWQKMAEKQMERGDKKAAFESYEKAVSALGSSASNSQRYLFDIKAALLLGESMRRNGLDAKGHRMIQEAQTMVGQIYEKQTEDRIKAFTLVAEAFWRLGSRAEAKGMLLEAYRLAHSYDVTRYLGDMKKGQSLSEVGQTTSLFFISGSQSHRATNH